MVKALNGNLFFCFVFASVFLISGLFSVERISFFAECLASEESEAGEIEMPFYKGPSGFQGRMALIKRRGTLIVGVKTDYPPWGMIDHKGRLSGLEADLAGDVARAVGVKLKLEGVSTKNRLQKLEDGTVDLVIATMGDNEKRRKISGLIQPNYYASGVNLMVSRQSPITDWLQLRGRPVCLTSGAYFNRDLIERYLIKARVFVGTRDTLLALKTGQCVGWAYDDTSINQFLLKEEWSAFHMPLPTILETPWAVAVKKEERESSWGLFMEDMVGHWHRSRRISYLQKKWGLKVTEFVREQEKLWAEKDEFGGYICRRRENDRNRHPAGCLYANKLPALESGGGASAGAKFIKERLGLDFSPMYDKFERAAILKGFGITLLLCSVSIFLCIVIGALMAAAMYKRIPVLAQAASLATTVSRFVPPLIQMYILFFGFGAAFFRGLSAPVLAFFVAALVLSMYAGASNANLMYNALKGLKSPKGSIYMESFRVSFDGIVANCVNNVKAAAMASAIALPEIVSATTNIITERGNASAMMNFLLIFYFLVVLCLIGLLKASKKMIIKWISK